MHIVHPRSSAYTLNPKPQTPNPKPQIRGLWFRTVYPWSSAYTLNPKPQTLNPKLEACGPAPCIHGPLRTLPPASASAQVTCVQTPADSSFLVRIEDFGFRVQGPQRGVLADGVSAHKKSADSSSRISGLAELK